MSRAITPGCTVPVTSILTVPGTTSAMRSETKVSSTLLRAPMATIYLSERSGLEAVCTLRALGDYPIKSLALDVGIRRPLGVGAGGLAILCALPPDEAESIIEANAPKYEKYGFVSADYLREAIKVGRNQGYAFLDSVVTPGTAAIGIAFPPENPIAALSVAAISGRLDSLRRDEVARLLRQQIRIICGTMSR